MRDKLFLCWLHERLVTVYKENYLTDYMWKMRSIIDLVPDQQDTPNTTLMSREDVKRFLEEMPNE